MAFPLFVLASSLIAVGTVAATWLLSSRRWLAVGTALVGSSALLLFHGPGFFDYYADDAFITLRYARNLADGLGPNWNSVGRVEGYTNFLWMATLAGVAKLGFDLVDASRVLGFLAILATFFFVYRIWKLWGDDEPGSGLDSPVVLAAVLLGLALTDGVAYWGFSGMESSLFMVLLTGGAYLYFLEHRGGRLPWSAVALAAAAMTRPEGLIAAAVTGGFKAAKALRSASVQPAVRGCLGWAGLFLILYSTYFLWRYSYYDYLLPNSFYAKVSPTTALFDRGLDYVWSEGLRYQFLPLFAGTALLLQQPRLRHDAGYVMTLTGFMLAGIVLEGGDDFAHARFIVPLLPLLYLAGLAGFATLLKRLALDPTRTALVAAAALSLGGLSLLPASHDDFVALERTLIEQRRTLGAWLSENTPPDYTIAANAVGAIAYYTDRDIVDLFGINDVVIAHTDVPDFGQGIAGHERYNADYVLGEVRPEIIVIGDAEPAPLTTEELRGRTTAPSSFRATAALSQDPRLWEQYQVRSLNIEGLWFNFLQRRDTIVELQGPGLLPP
jgi:hypothetical protein